MATLRDAERAREQAAELLRGLGAHAISVEEEVEDVAGAPPGATPGRQPPAPARPDAVGGAGPVEAGTGPARAEAVAGAPPTKRRRSFALVAWFADEPPADLPDSVEVHGGTRARTVPLLIRRVERFRAE